jgi:hypothetical protein
MIEQLKESELEERFVGDPLSKSPANEHSNHIRKRVPSSLRCRQNLSMASRPQIVSLNLDFVDCLQR